MAAFQDLGVALRGLFIIDPAGILRQVTINDIAVGRSVSETIRLLKAYQFVSVEFGLVEFPPPALEFNRFASFLFFQTDEYGEVCPANWDPEDKAKSRSIKADPKGALEYFAQSVSGDGTK